jgi:hypothetical protein
MRDVLETLAKLPEKCAAVIEDQSVFIRRGAPEPSATGLIAKDHVDQWNAANGVSPAQVQAMIVGVTLGWDKDGADPDTHAEGFSEPTGPFVYEFQAEFTTSVKVNAHTEAAAAELARNRLFEVAGDLNEDVIPIYVDLSTVGVSDTIDLVDTNDPR